MQLGFNTGEMRIHWRAKSLKIINYDQTFGIKKSLEMNELTIEFKNKSTSREHILETIAKILGKTDSALFQ